MPTVRDLLADARRRLTAAPFEPSRREAALLLGHVLGLSEAQVIGRNEREVEPAAAARFAELLARRLTGEPVSYLFGEREFYGRSFHVDRRVLIPRPETEHVIEEALKAPLPPSPWILDIGTGSGILAVTLALEIPGSRTVATDLSLGALAVAAGNARRLGASGRVRFAGVDLARGLDLSRFDLVVSNPPYIDPADAPSLSPEVCNFEPHLALFAPGVGPGGAGRGGDSILARLFTELRALRSGVRLIVEMGFGQLDAAQRHAETAGWIVLGARDDYAGIPRVLTLQRP
jgi:release factor glutamine methyltransferase